MRAFRTVVLLCAATVAITSTARADEALDRFEGSWRYADGADGVARIERGIERAIDGMAFFMKPFARSALRERSGPHRHIRFQIDAQRVTMWSDAWGPVSSVVGAPAREVRGPDGEALRMRQRLVNGRLEQRFASDDGARTNTYALSGDGRWLWLTARLESPRLPRAAVFRVRYRREG